MSCYTHLERHVRSRWTCSGMLSSCIPVLCRQLHQLAAAAVQALLQAHAFRVFGGRRLPRCIDGQAQAVALALELLLACHCRLDFQVGFLRVSSPSRASRSQHYSRHMSGNV